MLFISCNNSCQSSVSLSLSLSLSLSPSLPYHLQHELAPNVMAMVEAFNRVALLVPTEILQKTTPQARAKVISVFIQVSHGVQECV